jgi:hypothetical protein
MQTFSNGYPAETRPLPIALAHCMVVCKPGRDIARMLILNRLFNSLDLAGRLQTKAELAACRDAARNKRQAVVS